MFEVGCWIRRAAITGDAEVIDSQQVESMGQQKTLSAWQRGLVEYAVRSDANDIGGLEALGALQQVEFDGLAFIERAVTILLNGGKMNEDILPG